MDKNIPLIETDQTKPLPGNRKTSNRILSVGEKHMVKLEFIAQCHPEYITREDACRLLIDQVYASCRQAEKG